MKLSAIVIAALFIPLIAFAQDPGVTMAITSDPRFPSYSPYCGEVCTKTNSRAALMRQSDAIDRVATLGRWPSTLQQGAGAAVAAPAGVIVNGNLTDYFHKWQYNEYYTWVQRRMLGFASPPATVYPGLGNRDYKNNVGDCTSDWGSGFDSNRCAKEAVWFMRNQIQALPNVVNHDNSGSVYAYNNGLYNARFSVDYDDGGRRVGSQTDSYEWLQGRTISIPKTARNIHIRFQWYTFNVASGSEGYSTLREYDFERPPALCFEYFGDVGSANLSTKTCDDFPTGSNGSLSYAFELGDYHFVQLQYRPDYHVELPEDGTVFIGNPGFSVTESYGWLEDDLRRATSRGKLIVINMNNPTADGAVIDDPRFRSAIAGQNVVAVFGGHLPEQFGQTGALIDNGAFKIPVFHSSSSDCERFLLADFHKRYFNVAAVDSSTGLPRFVLNDGVQCRAGFQGGSNTSVTRPQTFLINRKPSVSGAIISSPANEGAELSFTAAGSDPDGDVLSYSWDFGDGTGAVAGLDATHTYADNGLYSVRVTATDPYGASATSAFTLTVANVTPTVSSPGGVTSDEGASAAFTASISDPGTRDSFTITVDWKDGKTSTATLAAGATGVTMTHAYADNGTYAATMTVQDKDGASAPVDKTFTVRNVHPVVSVVSATTFPEGGNGGMALSIVDPGVLDSFTLEVRWNDGQTQTIAVPAGAKSATLSHRYADDEKPGTPSDPYAVHIDIADKDGGTGATDRTVTVLNQNPSIAATGATVDETQTATISVKFTDPGVRDTFQLTIDWKDGTVQTFAPTQGTTLQYSHVYTDDNPTATPSDVYAVALTLVDKDTGSASTTAPVTVRNVNPAVTINGLRDDAAQPIGETDSVLAGLTVFSAESFSDVNPNDTRTAVRTWGDSSPAENLGAVTSSTNGSHVYAQPGTYTLTMVVTDDDTGTATASRTIRVVSPGGGIQEVIDVLSRMPSSRALAKALAALRGNSTGDAANGAIDLLAKGNLEATLVKLEEAIGYLQDAEAADGSLDFTKQKSTLALAAKSIAVGAGAASEILAKGQTYLAARNYIAAVRTFRSGL